MTRHPSRVSTGRQPRSEPGDHGRILAEGLGISGDFSGRGYGRRLLGDLGAAHGLDVELEGQLVVA